MRPTSKRKKTRVLKRIFSGETYGYVAEKENVSKSTVKKVFDEFTDVAADSSLEKAAEEYDVHDEIEILRDLAVESKRADASMPELLGAARLSILTKKLKLSPVDLEEHLTMYESHKEKFGDFALAAMKLSRLEKETGKTYRALITRYKETADRVRGLRENEQNLTSNIRDLTKVFKTATKKFESLNKKSKKAQKILDTLDRTKEELAAYGIRPDDFKTVKNFLNEIQRLRGDPAKAVETLEKNSSLEDNIKKKTRELDKLSRRLKEETKTCTKKTTELKETRERVSKLGVKESETVQRLEELKEDEVQQKGRLKALATSVAQMLGVKADVIEMNKAINATAEKLQNLEIAVAKKEVVLEDKQLEISKSEKRKQDLKLEVEGVLKIKDYATELKTAITGLEEKKASLEKECAEKSAKIALGETITNFLTRLPTADFNKFYSTVEWVKRVREERSSSLKFMLPRTEERIRMKALEAFKGDLVDKMVYNAVYKQKEDYRKENIDLKIELDKKDSELASVRKQNEFLEKLKVYVEGEQRSFKDLKNWVILVFNKEIERFADGKSDKLTARFRGLLEFIDQKRKERTKVS